MSTAWGLRVSVTLRLIYVFLSFLSAHNHPAKVPSGEIHKLADINSVLCAPLRDLSLEESKILSENKAPLVNVLTWVHTTSTSEKRCEHLGFRAEDMRYFRTCI